MKTKKAAAKRFSFTGSGKIKMKKSLLRHILTSKSPSRKRKMRKAGLVSDSDRKLVIACLPYGS